MTVPIGPSKVEFVVSMERKDHCVESRVVLINPKERGDVLNMVLSMVTVARKGV